MKLPFLKKNKTAEEDAGAPEKKKRVRFVVSIKRLFQRKGKGGDPEASDSEAPGKKKKPKKEKKPKPPKEKKPKKKKEKPQKVKREKDDGSKKKKPVLLIAAIGGVVLVGGGVAAFLLLRGGETVEEQLAKAAQYTVDEKYDDAQQVYDKLLEEDILLVDAYLGNAENYLAQERLDDAIFTLEVGYTAVEDPRIAEKLEEIRPEPEEPTEPVPSNEPIVWKDAALEKMVRQALGLNSTAPITEADLLDVKELKLVGGTHAATNEVVTTINTPQGYTIGGTLYSERGDIRTLDDLVWFKSLRKLTICYNQVTDISGIAELTGLDTLGLYFNNITDLSPLSSLTNLRYLYLYNNEIASLQPLSGLAELRSLSIQYNKVSDLTPLRGLSNLSELYVSNNSVSDISPLGGMNSLSFLYADNNQISDISVVETMGRLTDVSFIGNPIQDFSPAREIQNVKR